MGGEFAGVFAYAADLIILAPNVQSLKIMVGILCI